MKLVKTVAELQQIVKETKKAGKSGFVRAE